MVPRHARLNVKVSQGLCGYFDNFGSWGVKNLARKSQFSITCSLSSNIFRSSQIRCVGKSGKEELEVYSSVLLDRSGFLESQMRHFVKFYAWETYQLRDVFLILWTAFPTKKHVDRPSKLCFLKAKSPRHVEVTSAGLVAFWLRGLQTGKFWVFKLRPPRCRSGNRVAADPFRVVEVKVMLGAAGPETEAVKWCQCKVSESWYQDIIIIILLVFSKTDTRTVIVWNSSVHIALRFI